MDVRNFSIARDLLYASGALTGVALGYIVSLFRTIVTIRSRGRRITLIFIVFSAALAAFAAAIAVSFGDIFSSTGLFIVAGIWVPVFTLAVCFPRALAYPLILAGGLLVVWLGYFFLRFPLVTEGHSPPLYVYHAGNAAYTINILAKPGQTGDRAGKTVPVQDGSQRDSTDLVVLQISGNRPPLDIEGVLIHFHPWYPLIGGTERGLVTLIRRDNEILYTNTHPENVLSKVRHSRLDSFGIVVKSVGGTVSLDSIPRGADLAVFFAGEALSLQPSW